MDAGHRPQPPLVRTALGPLHDADVLPGACRGAEVVFDPDHAGVRSPILAHEMRPGVRLGGLRRFGSVPERPPAFDERLGRLVAGFGRAERGTLSGCPDARGSYSTSSRRFGAVFDAADHADVLAVFVERDEVVLHAFHRRIEVADADPADGPAAWLTIPAAGNLALFHEDARLLRCLEKALACLFRLFRALEAREAGFQRDEAAPALRPRQNELGGLLHRPDGAEGAGADLDGDGGKVIGHGIINALITVSAQRRVSRSEGS